MDTPTSQERPVKHAHESATLRPLPAARWNRECALHLLQRAAFGGTPAEVDSLTQLGLDRAVDSWFQPGPGPDPLPPPGWTRIDAEARTEFFKKAKEATPTERQELQNEWQREHRRQIVELQGWWLRRMATAPNPFQEKLTLFWHGHFATGIEKVREPALMWRQNQLFREHGSGDWLTLLDLVTRDPAMMVYLDQNQSRRDKPNENYARELLELFSMGEGNYTEQDVTEGARALTGLALDRLTLESRFNPRQHDRGIKTILGKTGTLDAWDLLQLIAQHPQSARFITAKLWNFFASAPLSQDLADALAAEFTRCNQNIGAFLRTLFKAEVFYSPEVVRHQIKSPVQLLVEACRQLERELPPVPVAANSLRVLGQTLFAPPNVKGWDGGSAWINTNTLLHRHNLALLLATGENALPTQGGGKRPTPRRRAAARMSAGGSGCDMQRLLPTPLRSDPEACVASLEQRLVGYRIPGKDRVTLVDFARSRAPLSDKDAAALLRLALCTPDYQLC